MFPAIKRGSDSSVNFPRRKKESQWNDGLWVVEMSRK